MNSKLLHFLFIIPYYTLKILAKDSDQIVSSKYKAMS